MSLRVLNVVVTLLTAVAPASALARHLGPDELGPETRVGVIDDAAELDVGARDAASPESHLGNCDCECELAVGSRWYLQPEPVQRSPYAQVLYAYAGVNLPAYAYAANNPVHYVDFDGLIIQANPVQRAAIDRLKDDLVIGQMVMDLDNSKDIVVSLADVPGLLSGETGGVYTPGRSASSGCVGRAARPATFDVKYNMKQATRDMRNVFGLTMRSPLEEILAHELGHAWGYHSEWRRTGIPGSDAVSNAEAVRWQNAVRNWNWLSPRSSH